MVDLLCIITKYVNSPHSWNYQVFLNTVMTYLYTRKYPLRGYFLAPPGQRKRITLKFDQSVTLRDVTWRYVTETDIRTERHVRWNIILDIENIFSTYKLADKNFDLGSDNLPKIIKKEVVWDALKGKFTPAVKNYFF